MGCTVGPRTGGMKIHLKKDKGCCLAMKRDRVPQRPLAGETTRIIDDLIFYISRFPKGLKKLSAHVLVLVRTLTNFNDSVGFIPVFWSSVLDLTYTYAFRDSFPVLPLIYMGHCSSS